MPEAAIPIAPLSSPRARGRWLRWLARCATILGGLAAGLGVAEAVFAYRDGGAFPHLNVYVADPELGVRLEPGATEAVAFGGNPVTRIRINRDGFRGDELPPPGADDVLVVGDSQVFGLGVEQDETFSARLAAAIGRPVLNAGVPTYGPDEYRAVIAEQLARRHPRTVVVTINLANDLFEAEHPNRERHAVWDGWAVRRETAPGAVTGFPGRELLYRRSHLFFALRKWWHGRVGNSEAMEETVAAGFASEGSWRDIVRSGEQVQRDRRALDQARRDRVDAVTAAHRDLVRAEGEVDDQIARHVDADRFALAVARASPGDIVDNPFAEAARSTLATADQIARAAAERARLRDQLARWASSHTTADARGAAASLAAGDQALARLTALDAQDLRAALEPPLAGYLRDVQHQVEHAGARLVVVILPLDVQVSPAEWRKYGVERSESNMEPSLALNAELVALCRALGVAVLDATPVLAAAEPGAFLDRDIHMTPKGHAAVAAALAATLREAPPVRAAASPRSPVPLPDVFRRSPEVIVAGSSDAGCETKQVREWLRVQCTRGDDRWPVDAQVTGDDGHEAMVLVMPGEVSLLVPVVEGRELTATLRWTDRTRVLRVAWPAGAARPTLAFERPVARRPAADPGGPAFRSPVERAICACWQTVFGSGNLRVPFDERSEATGGGDPAGSAGGAGGRGPPPLRRIEGDVNVCHGAYGVADPACVERYGAAPGGCPALLACTRRDPGSPP